MKKNKQVRFTAKDFTAKFPNDVACLDWLVAHRYPNGIECPTCKKVTKHHKLSKRPVYECDNCGHQVSPLAGTIFHKSPTPLKVWFEAIYEMATTRTGYSAKALQRKTGVTYKTAWRMFKQIRTLLDESDEPKLDGIVEADTTYVGGKSEGVGQGSLEGKTPVLGVVERNGDVRTKVVENIKWANVTPFIASTVAKRSVLCTDEGKEFKSVEDLGLIHRTVNHDIQYNNGGIHTNNIEGFWSLVKRGISGCYHSVSPEYLQSYVNEYAFRYNHRDDHQAMFQSFLKQI